MATIIENMLKSFRKIKADAVPRPPRPSKSEKIPPRQETSYSTQTSYTTEEPEEVFVESDDYIGVEDFVESEEDTKPKAKTENGKKKKWKSNNSEQHENGSVYVNAQAGGNVMNIFNAVGVHVGPTINIGSMGMKKPKSDDSDDSEEPIKKSNLIKLLMEAEIKPEPKHLMCVSKHLGKNWHRIFTKLGFTKGEIETKEIKSEPYGVTEARYQLLLEWVRKDEENTLGRLAKILWDLNERGVVKELAKVYNGGI